ncbi:MAG: class I SAM-dependent methyltransferase [Burkholderiales bacterium]
MPEPRARAGLPEPDASARVHSERVTAAIRHEIDAAGGWISFARYMELALYAPGLGYYAAGAAKFGTAGDFVTAPEVSPLFARTLARQAAQVVTATGGSILELGAGSGRLAADLLRALQALDALPERYAILEVSADLKARQREHLAATVPEFLPRVAWLTALPTRWRGLVLANEVLDALPVHLIVNHEGVWRERGVTWVDGFRWEDAALASSDLVAVTAHLPGDPGYCTEISLAAPRLVASLADLLEAGTLLLIDYGFGRREYYHPQRATGTLMCHYRHHAHDDPFFLPGLQDITAHVEFTAVAEAAIDHGLALQGYTSQARFLLNCGITELLQVTPPENAAAYLPLAAGVQKLLAPSEMGELFKVMALGRGLDAPLIGFAAGDLSRLL